MKKKRRENDAEYDQKIKEKKREYERKRLTDPEYREKTKQWAKAHYAKKSHEIQKANKSALERRLAAMTNDELELYLARKKEFGRRQYAKRGGSEEYKKYAAEYRKRRAFQKLIINSQILIQKDNKK